MTSLITTTTPSYPMISDSHAPGSEEPKPLLLAAFASIISDYLYCPNKDMSRFITITKTHFNGMEGSNLHMDYNEINGLIGGLREISFICTGQYGALDTKINCLAHARFLFTSGEDIKAFVTIYHRTVVQRFTENSICKALLLESNVIPSTDNSAGIYYELDGSRPDDIVHDHGRGNRVKSEGPNPLLPVLPPVSPSDTAIPQNLKVSPLLADKYLPIPKTN